MLYTSNQSWERVVLSEMTSTWNTGGLHAHTQQVTSWVDTWWAKAQREPEHRKRPTDVLSSLTAQPEAYTEIYNHGIASVTSFKQYYYESILEVSRVPSTLPVWWPCSVPNWETDFRNKVKSEAVNLADSIGEWRESVEVVHRTAHLLKKAAEAAKRQFRPSGAVPKTRKGRKGRQKRGKTWTESAVDVLGGDLAIKFGVKPYVNLAVNLQDALATACTKGVLRRIVVSKGDSQSKVSTSSVFRWEYKDEVDVRVVGYVKMKPYLPVWTAGNPAEAIWAGTRLSFMVDYFWNFGGWLSSLDAMDSVVSVSGTLCTRRFARAKGTAIAPYKTDKPARWSRRSHVRVVIGSIPVGSLPLPSLPKASTPTFQKLTTAVEMLAGMRYRASKR